MDKFFTEYDYYTDDKLATELDITVSEAKKLLPNYADLILGRKIRDCIRENGDCEFTAEC